MGGLVRRVGWVRTGPRHVGLVGCLLLGNGRILGHAVTVDRVQAVLRHLLKSVMEGAQLYVDLDQNFLEVRFLVGIRA